MSADKPRRVMNGLSCGHDKPEYGRSGMCQACYRRARRREIDPLVGTRKPGPKPKPRDPSALRSHRKKPPENLTRKFATETHCANGHALTPENTYVYPDDSPNAGQKVCKVCRANAQRTYTGKEPVEREQIGVWNRNKTHCPHGHEYTADNTYVIPGESGSARRCKMCARDSRLRYLYGFGLDEYDRRFAKQHGRCAVAGCTTTLDEENLHVDHDHACCSGQRSCGRCVRGLLCDRCNLVLGRVEDDADLLVSLARYLRRRTVAA